MAARADADQDPTRRSAARRGLAVYFGGVLLGSGACEAWMLWRGEPIERQLGLVLLNMWVPAAAALVARLVQREGFGDVSLARVGTSARGMLWLAWLCPLLAGGLAYGVAWGLGLAAFAAPSMAGFGLGAASPALKLATSLAINLTLGTVLAGLSAAGEELGWRGYMLTRLIDAGCPRPLLCSGLIWSAWHVPLIVSGQYAAGPAPLPAALLFVVSTSAGGVVAARVRLQSGSVWPAMLYHAAWNALIQGTFDAFTVPTRSDSSGTFWTGESGLLVALVNLVLALLLLRRAWPALRRPHAAPFACFDLRNA